jgi:hypothetical protein
MSFNLYSCTIAAVDADVDVDRCLEDGVRGYRGGKEEEGELEEKGKDKEKCKLVRGERCDDER